MTDCTVDCKNEAHGHMCCTFIHMVKASGKNRKEETTDHPIVVEIPPQ